MASPRTQRLSLQMYRRSCDRKSITVTPLLIPPNTRKHELECRCAITSLEPNGGHHDGGYHLVIRGHGFLLGLPARQHKENPEDNDDQDYADDVFLDDDKSVFSSSQPTPSQAAQQLEVQPTPSQAAQHLEVRFSNPVDGLAVHAKATLATRWSVECVVPSLIKFRGLSNMSISVVSVSSPSFSCVAGRRFKLVEKSDMLVLHPPPRESWHWKHTDGAKYCRHLFDIDGHGNHGGKKEMEEEDDTDKVDLPYGLHYLLAKRIEWEKKDTLRLQSRLEMYREQQHRASATSQEARFQELYQAYVIKAVSLYVERFFVDEQRLNGLEAELEQLKTKNERMRFKLSTLGPIMQGRHLLFVHLLLILEKQVAKQELDLRSKTMELMYMKKYVNKSHLRQIVTLTTYREKEVDEDWNFYITHAATWATVNEKVFTEKRVHYRLSEELTAAQLTVRIPLIFIIASIVRKRNVADSLDVCFFPFLLSISSFHFSPFVHRWHGDYTKMTDR